MPDANQESIFPLSSRYLVTEVNSLYHQITRVTERSLTRQGLRRHGGISGWVLLFLSDHIQEEVFQKDVERAFALSRSSASKMINQLQQQDLLRRERVKRDGRLRRLVLTEQAIPVAEQLRQNAIQTEKRFIKAFTEQELYQLEEFFSRLRKNLV